MAADNHTEFHFFQQKTRTCSYSGLRNKNTDTGGLENIVWSDKSQFLLFHTDGRTRVWRKTTQVHASIMPCVNIAGWWWWCDGVGCALMAHIGPLIKVEQHLNAKRYLNIIANQVHLFMAAVYPYTSGFLQQDNAPCHKDRIVQEWFHEHDGEFSLLQWPAQSPDLNPIEHLWDDMERAIHSQST